jgi:hypothetical protein
MSRLNFQERELEPGDNVFIIHSRSNHNYENFTVGSGRVSGQLLSGHFGSRVISGWVESGIGSSSVGSFRVSGRIRSGRVLGHLVSDHFGFRIVSGRIR